MVVWFGGFGFVLFIAGVFLLWDLSLWFVAGFGFCGVCCFVYLFDCVLGFTLLVVLLLILSCCVLGFC